MDAFMWKNSAQYHLRKADVFKPGATISCLGPIQHPFFVDLKVNIRLISTYKIEKSTAKLNFKWAHISEP